MELREAVESNRNPAEIARGLGVSPGRGSQIAALRKLEPDMREAIWSGWMSPAHGYQLSRVKLSSARRELFNLMRTQKEPWSRDELKRRVDAMRKGTPMAEVSMMQDPNIRALADELGEMLAPRVEIHHGNGGAGSLVIRYFSLDELDGVVETIRQGKGRS